MRIISGRLGGQIFESPTGHKTHPMSERVRGALFNKLGDVTGMTVLDAYGGSGALSFEALSRGAVSAIAVDNDKNAAAAMLRAAAKLRLNDKAKIIQANIVSWSRNNPDIKFDLIFADPPYEKMKKDHILRLSQHLKPKGLMVLSYPGRESAPTVNGVVVVDNKSYGDAALAFYRLARPLRPTGKNQNTG